MIKSASRLLNCALIACAGLMLAVASAHADNRLFPDSRIVAGDRISVEVVGKGPDLILIPGLACSRATWKATAERLKGHYRLHLVQVAGFAGEPAGANKDGAVVEPTAEAIDAYIVAHKLAPATLIGHSLGGTMSLWLAEHHPEHLKKVLLVDALPSYATVIFRGANPPAEQRHAIAAQISQSMTKVSDADYAKALDGQMASYATSPADKEMIKGWTLASDRGVVARAIGDDVDLDLSPGLAELKVPVTLLYPDYKTPNSSGMDTRYRGAYAPAKTMTIERIDQSMHFIMFDQPDAFAAALDGFLKK
jgi:pimeloyl-ACP methyl ester carboxylesterase